MNFFSSLTSHASILSNTPKKQCQSFSAVGSDPSSWNSWYSCPTSVTSVPFSHLMFCLWASAKMVLTISCFAQDLSFATSCAVASWYFATSSVKSFPSYPSPRIIKRTPLSASASGSSPDALTLSHSFSDSHLLMLDVFVFAPAVVLVSSMLPDMVVCVWRFRNRK